MVLSILKKTLFAEEEFIIDQAPEPVHLEERPSDGSAAPSEAAGEGAKPQDLFSQMDALLVEQVRLAEKARHLEMKGAGNDEFGRFAKQLLPFLDNFSHVLDLARERPPSEELNAWLKSVESLYSRITSLLEQYDLRFVNSIGKVVNLDIHEVIDYRFTDQFPHNTVIKEVAKGVVFRGHLLRDAKVVVACNPNEDGAK